MAERRGRPPNLPPPPDTHSDSQSERPTWTVTRRERTELSPLRSTSPFQSRTVTTTERVQILQMPITLTDEQIAPARLLAFSPSGNTSQSVSSTVTTMQGEGTPLISGVTANGTPLFNGILICPEARHTTTIITTTTTTYRMIEVSDSDSLSDDFEIVDDNTLTVDVSLAPSPTTSPQYMIVGKTESEAPLSPITRARMHIDLDFSPKEITKEIELEKKPIMEMVTVYHNGVSAKDEKAPTEEKVVEYTSVTYPHDQIPSTSDSETTTNIQSSIDLKTISTSSEDEDIVIVGTDMVEMISSGSSFSGEKIGRLQKSPLQIEFLDEQKSPTSEERQEDFETVEESLTPTKCYGFPSTAAYNGPMEITSPNEDIRSEPIIHHVSVYHSGRSDEPPTKKEKTSDTTADIAKALGHKIMNLFAKQSFPYEYPVSEPYHGPLEATRRKEDIDSQPIHNVVSVYHIGRSDIPQEPTTAATTETVLQIKDMYYDYSDSPIESPLSSTYRMAETEEEPLTYDVSMYQSGRSGERAPKSEKPEEGEIFDVAEAAKTFGVNISGFLRNGYPISEVYEGPMDSINRVKDIEREPISQRVSLYHSGISDVPQEGRTSVVETVINIRDRYFDYPTTAAYEGPLDSTTRTSEIEGEP
ncbi:unnamed protein product, partial [Strongylus vulgaris]